MDISKTLLKLIASTDLRSAKELTEIFPELDFDQEVVTTLKTKLDMEDVDGNTISDLMLEQTFRDFREEYGYFAALVFAYLLGNSNRINAMKRELSPGQENRLVQYNKFALFLEGNDKKTLLKEGILAEEMFYQIFLLDLLSYLPDTVMKKYYPEDYFNIMIRKGNWKKCKEIYLSKSKDIKLRETFYNNLLGSGIPDIFTNIPKEIVGIPDFNFGNFTRTVRNSESFPWNLSSKEQVEYFYEDIKEMSEKELEFNRAEGFDDYGIRKTTVESYKAIRDIFGKRLLNKSLDVALVCYAGDYEENVKLFQYFGYSESDYLLTAMLAALRSKAILFVFYVKKYQRLGIELKKIDPLIQAYQNQYGIIY